VEVGNVSEFKVPPVTLILTINGRETIWLLADRRLSSKARAPRDDARKVMFLETTDGVAILGYAGLGATALGTEPADWMSGVLRGRDLRLEQSLGALAGAMSRQFPQHMTHLRGDGGRAHLVIITSFVDSQARLYTIELVCRPDGRTCECRCTRHIVEAPTLAAHRTPRVAMAGTGATYLIGRKDWRRSLLHVIGACDRRQVSPHTVADQLARLNYEVSQGISDESVGPRCVVAWRHSRKGVHKGGGAHQFYTGSDRESNMPSLPSIASGMDIEALSGMMLPLVLKAVESTQAGEPPGDLDLDELDTQLALLPDEPDEDLP